MSEERTVSEVEELVPSGQITTVVFGVDDHLQYVQRPLSFFGKMEVFSVLGSAVEKAIKGGLDVSELLTEETSEADGTNQFISGIARLVQYAPEFLLDLYVVSLGVPRGERDYVKSIMELPEEDGGLSDDQGMQILETFIEQNWDVMVDFFKQRIMPLITKVTKREPESQSSKPSKATRQATQKA